MQKLLLISVIDQSAGVVIKNPWKYQTRGENRLNQKETVIGVSAWEATSAGCARSGSWGTDLALCCWTRMKEFQTNVPVYCHHLPNLINWSF